ncbi:MAG: tetratricopeptide repeat protein [Fimbriimonadaceae bacterium]|nr:tetratricopeptide repeat protein [Fimbriimonadaceae bacterium]QYK55756.1 MAG: tetratricopeptide repeat protein [Fimbriimonadaceae bacterium]
MNVEELYERALSLRHEGRYPEAQAAFQEVLGKAPFHTKSRWQLALIQGFLGDFEGSLEALRTLAFEEPDDLDVRYDLGMTYMMLAMNEEACAEFSAILAVDPNHENARRQIVYC